jgi:ADP-ribose pyrophosphatase
VPSGLIDPNETPSECALRELKEETGYIATIPTTPPPQQPQQKPHQPTSTNTSDPAESFVMFNDPGFCNTNTQMVTVHVDMADPRNQPDSLRPELEENEFIESFSLPLETLWEDLRRLEAEEGVAIDARVGTLAMGIEVAKRFRLGGGLGREKESAEEVRN